MKEHENRPNTYKMIAPNELRLGNYVYNKATRENIVVECFVPDVDCMSGKKPEMYRISNSHFPALTDYSIEGIALTERWLLDFGFEKSGDLYVFETLAVSLKMASDAIWCGIYTSSGWVKLTYIKFVHSLQNLYFVITEEELQLCKHTKGVNTG